jgi:hypothetical protein
VTLENLVLDLFSGTGSATQPFVECGGHRVVRIDIAGKPDIRADVRRLPLDPDLRPEFVWASPPCTEFSQLTFLRVYHPGGQPPDPEKGMELVRYAFEVARRARYWCVENVRRSEQFISPEFGRPFFRKDAWCLWGNLDGMFLPTSNRMRKGIAARFALGGKWDPGAGDRNKTNRAVIPRPLAEAVHRAVCDREEP